MKGTEFDRHCFEGLIMCCVELGLCHVDDDILENALDLTHLSSEEAILFEARSVLPYDFYHIEGLFFLLELFLARMPRMGQTWIAILMFIKVVMLPLSCILRTFQFEGIADSLCLLKVLLDHFVAILQMRMQVILLIDLDRRLAFQGVIVPCVASAPWQLVGGLSNVIHVHVLLMQALQFCMRLDSIDELGSCHCSALLLLLQHSLITVNLI